MLGEDGVISLSGNRYTDAGKKLPSFRKWSEDTCGLDVNRTTFANKTLTEPDAPILNDGFMEAIKGNNTTTSNNNNEN